MLDTYLLVMLDQQLPVAVWSLQPLLFHLKDHMISMLYHPIICLKLLHIIKFSILHHPPDLFCQGPQLGLFFLQRLGQCRPNFFKRNKKTTRRLILPRFRSLWWLENQSLNLFLFKTCFSTHFLPKTPIKHMKNHDKPIYCIKKQNKKTILKTKTDSK